MISKRDLFAATAATGGALLARPALLSAQGLVGTVEAAEAAFHFGLPIVMNYAVMHEFCLEPGNPQYKAPFNTIYNEARVFTWQDTAIPTPNSDTPYSMVWLDLRAEPIVLSVPDVPAGR